MQYIFLTVQQLISWGADWRQSSCRRKRPLKSIILEPETKTMIMDDCRDFLENEQWYLDRGIPYRRGYLLVGILSLCRPYIP